VKGAGDPSSEGDADEEIEGVGGDSVVHGIVSFVFVFPEINEKRDQKRSAHSRSFGAWLEGALFRARRPVWSAVGQFHQFTEAFRQGQGVFFVHPIFSIFNETMKSASKDFRRSDSPGIIRRVSRAAYRVGRMLLAPS
jgi:hypothetical protein